MASTVPASLTVLHEAFAKRMKQACDANEDIPPLNDGRLVWIRTKMSNEGHDVSLQTAMRWYYGAAYPRPAKMASLAKVLGVSPAWLSMGREEKARIDTTARRISTEGAVNALAGHFQMAGIACAFPDKGDPKADLVHFYSIIEGRQHPIHVTSGEVEHQKHSVTFQVPNNHGKVVVVLVLPMDQKSIEVWHVPSDVIESAANRDSDMKTVSGKLNGRVLSISRSRVSPVLNLTKALPF